MPNRPMKNCKTCGKPFMSSANDYTVNCPEHRGGKFKAGGKTYKQSTSVPYMETQHTCKTCGKTFSRGDAYAHRRETGHKFI